MDMESRRHSSRHGNPPGMTVSTRSDETPRSLPDLPELSRDSTGSSMASGSLPQPQQYYGLAVQDDDDRRVGYQSPRTGPQYACIFRHALPCNEILDSPEYWWCHVTSHLRAHRAPTRIHCIVCGLRFENSAPGEAWKALLDHVIHSHLQHGESLVNVKPDLEFTRILFNLGVIPSEQLRDIQLPNSSSKDARPRGQVQSPSEQYYCSSRSARKPRPKPSQPYYSPWRIGGS
jgi:hypothetical protein